MLKSLIAVRLRSLFSGMLKNSNGSKKRSTGIKIAMLLLAAYVLVCLFGMFAMLFYSICEPFSSAGLSWLYFAMSGIAAFALSFIGSVFSTQAIMFESRDNALLLSMPIKPSLILGSRISALLALNYLFSAFVMLPCIVVYLILMPFSALGLLFFILCFLFLPLLSMTLSCLLGWILAYINTKINKKNLITTIFSILFLIAYFYFFSKIQSYMTYLITNGEQIAAVIQKAMFPFYHMGVAVADGNILNMLLFLLCCIVPFAVIYLLLSANFTKITTSTGSSRKVKYREKTLKVSGARRALVNKELSHFLSNPMYILNAAMGSILAVILAGAAVIKLNAVLGYVAQMGLNVPIAAIAAFAMAICSGMNFVSAPSVSLEGKNLWISKSIPVSSADILEAKATAHFIAGLPAILLASTVLNIVLKVTPAQAALMYLLPLSANALSAYLGVTVNLKFPKMDWISDVHAIKQSASTMICMLGGMAIGIVPIIIYTLLLSGILSAEIFILICCAVFITISALLRIHIRGGGARTFDSL